MKYRSRPEIIDSILRSIGSGEATRTRIMYRAYLSYAKANEYLELLQKRQLIEFSSQTRRFQLTERALEYMNAYREISLLLLSVDSAA